VAEVPRRVTSLHGRAVCLQPFRHLG
jgi:hypothetical protein